MTIKDWRDNPALILLTCDEVASLDRKRLEAGREKDPPKRLKLIEAYELWQVIYARRNAEAFDED